MERKTLEEGFWNDRQEAQRILKEISSLQENVQKYEELLSRSKYICDLLEMATEEKEEELFKDTVKELISLVKDFREYELLILFAGDH
ncbi:MAG: PCRF domain-containing protein, partial [Syntrophomonadaceae bacterium]|nr:PCRF domain-containing protein [Syntrophomonadaceae bacterium]